jgi:hypothetical protein
MYPRAAAVTGLVLILPWFEIEPMNSWFKEADGMRQNTLSIWVLCGSMLLTLAAFAIQMATVVRGVRANPLNLWLGVAIGSFLAVTCGVFVVDQLPCWLGVPNCD